MTEKRQTWQGYIIRILQHFAWCSFKLWWNFCPDLSRSKFHLKGERSIHTGQAEKFAWSRWESNPRPLGHTTLMLLLAQLAEHWSGKDYRFDSHRGQANFSLARCECTLRVTSQTSYKNLSTWHQHTHIVLKKLNWIVFIIIG
jgi:hypothetical protein